MTYIVFFTFRSLVRFVARFELFWYLYYGFGFWAHDRRFTHDELSAYWEDLFDCHELHW